MFPENHEGTRVMVGSMNMVYVSDTASNRTHNLFRPKCVPIPLGHIDGRMYGVSLKDRKRSEDLYSLLGVQSVAEVVRRGRLIWFGMWNVRVEMIWYLPVGMWWWQGQEV